MKAAKQKRFPKTNQLAEQVRFAMPLARERLIVGVNAVVDAGGGSEDLTRAVFELTGREPEWPSDPEDQTFAMYEEALAAAHALGIATGLMLRPDVFAQPRKGGV